MIVNSSSIWSTGAKRVVQVASVLKDASDFFKKPDLSPFLNAPSIDRMITVKPNDLTSKTHDWLTIFPTELKVRDRFQFAPKSTIQTLWLARGFVKEKSVFLENRSIFTHFPAETQQTFTSARRFPINCKSMNLSIWIPNWTDRPT
mgnify:CR=1 FL=1